MPDADADPSDFTFFADSFTSLSTAGSNNVLRRRLAALRSILASVLARVVPDMHGFVRLSSSSSFLGGVDDGTVGASIWAPSDTWGWACVAVCEGHGQHRRARVRARLGPRATQVLTGSRDCTIKMWDLSAAVPRVWAR